MGVVKKCRCIMPKRPFPAVTANSSRFNLVKLFKLDDVFLSVFSGVLFWPVGGLQHLRRVGLASVMDAGNRCGKFCGFFSLSACMREI